MPPLMGIIVFLGCTFCAVRVNSFWDALLGILDRFTMFLLWMYSTEVRVPH